MTISLGVIETVGLTRAIQAADAACKAAGVNLTGYRKAGAGLVSVYFEGEISAVTAAVECGLDVIRHQDEDSMSLVMARPDNSVLAMLANSPNVRAKGHDLAPLPIQECATEQLTSKDEERPSGSADNPVKTRPVEASAVSNLSEIKGVAATNEQLDTSANNASTRKPTTSRRKRTNAKSQGTQK